MPECVPATGFCEGDPPPCPTSLVKSFTGILMDPATIHTAVGFIVAVVMREFVKSFVDNIVMPPIGAAIGKRDFSQLFLIIHHPRYQTVAQLINAHLVYRGQFGTVKEAEEAGVDTKVPIRSIAEAKKAGAATWNYGLFINSAINVLITTFALAMFVCVINKSRYWRWKRFCKADESA